MRMTRLSVSMIALIMGSSAANAQTSGTAPAASPVPENADSGLKDIVVTAQRRAENLQSVPVAVTALTAESLQSKGISSSTDLGSVTPGLSYSTIAGSAQPRIRGVGSAISRGGNESAVATYVDGVYIGSSAASTLLLNNVEQVAVLKGPQGTLFGRNATGGLIQITTKDPRQDFGGALSATYGNLNTIGGNLYVTGGLAEGVAADLAVYYNDQRDGFGRNLTTGSYVNKSRDFAIRSKIKIEIGASTVVRIIGDYSSTYAALPAFRLVYGSIPVTGMPFTGGKFDIQNDIDPLADIKQGGGSLNVTHDFGSVSLLSITAYRKANFYTVFDIDKTPTFLTRNYNHEPQNQFSQELQLQSGRSGAFRWVLGAYYFNSNSGYEPLMLTTPASNIYTQSVQKTRSVAGFAQGSYEFLPRTTLTLGLRYTDENKNFNTQGHVTFNAGGGVVTPPASGELTAHKLTWRAALDHRFDDGTLVYLSYNRGFKSGGFNPQQSTAPLTPFQPEVLDAGEAGLKTELLDKHLRVNTAAYYYKYKNIQVNAFQNGVSTIYNAASATIYGLDTDATAVVTRHFNLDFGLSLIHDRYGNFPAAIISIPLVPNGTTIRGGNAITSGNAQGNRLSLTPDWTADVGADYTVPLSSGSIKLSTNFFHSNGFRAEPDNRLRQGPYNLVNASVSWLIGQKGLYSISAYAKNIGNVAYAVQMNAQNTSDGVFVGPGRTYGLTLGAKF